MASVGIRCGGNRFLLGRPVSLQDQNAHVRPCTVAAAIVPNDKKIKRINKIRKSATMSTEAVVGALPKRLDSSAYYNKNEKAVVYEKLDEWMKGSVAEIVKNLREAPLLVHVYPKNEGKTREVALKTEKAREENWPVAIRKWQRRETPVPEGVIFVEQLDDNDAKDKDAASRSDSSNTREWGIVVQGRAADCEPACYLLKTTSADSGLGGSWCTHFCLIKVKSFKETAKSQLRNCWLCQSS